MALMKRATKKLAESNYPDLEVHKNLHGYVCRNKTYRIQHGKVYGTPQEAIDAVLVRGELPEEGYPEDYLKK